MGQLLTPAVTGSMLAIDVSPEMTALLGDGAPGDHAVPPDPIALVFQFGASDSPPSVFLDTAPALPMATVAADRCHLVFLIARPAIERIGGGKLLAFDQQTFHLPSELRAMALAVRDAPVLPEAVSTYRVGKCIEMVCEAIRLFAADQLVPVAGDGDLSPADTQRLMAARRLIDERWNEKLTLDAIARACGLNRAKLTRGFRDMFRCSVAEALAERRLAQAGRLLLTTDLPVSLVGYEAGYLNNASFARAFGRHFGRTPSHYRATGMAA